MSRKTQKRSKPPLPRINKRTGQHLKSCQCSACNLRRLSDYRERVRVMSKVRPPEEGQLIPVQGHFRRHPRYLSQNERLKVMVERFVRSLVVKS